MNQPMALNEKKIIVTKYFIFLKSKYFLYFMNRPSKFNKTFLHYVKSIFILIFFI